MPCSRKEAEEQGDRRSTAQQADGITYPTPSMSHEAVEHRAVGQARSGRGGSSLLGRIATHKPLWALLFPLVIASGCASSPAEWRKRRQARFEQEEQEREALEKTARRKRRKRRRRRPLPVSRELDALAEKLNASPKPIENKRLLARIFRKLDQLDRTKEGLVRILHLGDSHIAADYITRTVRERFQARFGDAGRGFVVVDQRAPYGGRRLKRKGWRRERIVDRDGPGKPFGFSGMRLISKRRGASVKYVLKPNDHELVVYFHGTPRGAGLQVYAEEELIGEVPTRRRTPESGVERVEIPEHRLGGATPPEWLEIRATGSRAKMVGLSFESTESGVIYDSVGPVGADAKVYLDLEQSSFRAHLQALAPDLFILMVGGNDALMVRQGRRTLEEVRQHHVELVRKLKAYLPEADCLLFGPMDAGEPLEDGRIGTKPYLLDVRDIQRDVAKDLGCAFWDTLEAMGGEGSFGRWLEAEIMNEDMVHPRSKGGDLLGHLFSTALMNAYLGND